MIRELERLVEEQRYAEALALAEELILRPGNSPQEFTAIYCAFTTIEFQRNNYYRSMKYGELARSLAKDIEEWDYFGTACWLLAMTYYYLYKYESGILACYEYLDRRMYYRTAAKFELRVRFTLGLLLRNSEEHQEAIAVFQEALKAAEKSGHDREAHGMRHALISLYLKCGDLKPIPRLMAKCQHFTRHHPHPADYSYLWHTIFKCQFAIATKRYVRAERIALKGLDRVNDLLFFQSHLHMVLAQIALAQHHAANAMARATAARCCAMKCRRYDLESEATELMHKISRQHPDAILGVNLNYVLTPPDLISDEGVKE